MILAGTGHRPDKLGGYGEVPERHLRMFAYTKLLDLKSDVVISGMAVGWDQALAWGAVKAGIPFHAYAPFVGQESRWPPKSQAEYGSLLSLADSLVFCSDGGYAPWKMQIRNERMVDASNLVLALWDGSSGGTDNCVGYASRKGVEIFNVWDEWKEFNGN